MSVWESKEEEHEVINLILKIFASSSNLTKGDALLPFVQQLVNVFDASFSSGFWSLECYWFFRKCGFQPSTCTYGVRRTKQLRPTGGKRKLYLWLSLMKLANQFCSALCFTTPASGEKKTTTKKYMDCYVDFNLYMNSCQCLFTKHVILTIQL